MRLEGRKRGTWSGRAVPLLAGCPRGNFINSAPFSAHGRLGEASLPGLSRHAIYSRFFWGTARAGTSVAGGGLEIVGAMRRGGVKRPARRSGPTRL